MGFESRVREIAGASGLVVTEATEDIAVLFFSVAGTKQVLQITPYDEVWEFACVSSLSAERDGPFGDRFKYFLGRNARLKRAFWAIREVDEEGREVFACVANFPAYLLTSEEFKLICWAVVHETTDAELAALVFSAVGGEEAG